MRISALLVILFALIGIISCTNISKRTLICDNENLPSTFDSLSYLGFNGEFAFFDTFVANYNWMTHEISFTLTQTSAVRFYVAPKYTVDIDLWLYLNTTPPTYLQHSSLAIGDEEVIQAVLNPGVYVLQFIFIGSSPVPCETLDFEASISPLQQLLQRTSQYTCPQPNYPLIDFNLMANTSEWNVHFDGGNTDFIAPRESSTVRSDVRFLKGYNFSVPSTELSQQWRISVEMGFDFLTSGSLGLIIIKNDGQAPRLCSQDDGCVLGVDDRLNYNIIKTVLTEGAYTLWIYDTIGEANSTLAGCTPFSFKIDIEKIPQVESFLTCTYNKLPSNLNAPGLIDSPAASKYFYFSEKILVAPRVDSMTFEVKEESYLKVWLNEHRLDLDLYLLDSQQNIIASSYSFFEEENIAMVLTPGTYKLSLVVFGSYTPQFCETYDFMFSIAELNDTINLCSGNTVALTLPNITQELETSSSFRYNGGDQIYSYVYPGTYAGPKVVTSTEFTLTGTYSVKVEIDYNFVRGDLQFTIKSNDVQFPIPFRARHTQTKLSFVQVLGAGSYTLELTTGGVQSGYSPEMLSRFPTCIRYKFDIQMDLSSTIDSSTNSNCYQHLNLPTTLNTPAFLEQSNFVHVSEDYYIPKGRVVQRDVVFTVEVPSFFRIYTDPNAVDVDIYLLESGIQVARSIDYNKEESIVWFLDPKEEYTIRFYFFRFGQISSQCETFRLEYAIEPTTYLVSPCQGTNLPPQDLITSFTAPYPFVSENVYTYTQTNQSFSYDIPFVVAGNSSSNVSDVAIIRVLSRFNFLWGHLSIYIISDATNQTIATGVADQASANDLLPFRLIAGSYRLRLAQPATSTAELDRCVVFSLQIMIDNVASEQLGEFGCLAPTIQTTLNNAAGMNKITGNRVHLSTETLAKILQGYDYADFTLAERSVFRVFVPSHPMIDIDVILARGSHQQFTEIIAASLGYEDETIFKDMDAGSYVLFYRFLPFPSQSLPSVNDCPSFPTQIAIYPYAYLSNVTSISTSCETVLPPTSIAPNQAQTFTFQRDPSTNLYHEIQINVPNGGRVHFHSHLEFEFLTSNILMFLTQPGQSKIISKMGTNRAYLDTLLSPGNWTLTLSAISTSVSNINCARGSLFYFLNTTIDPTDCPTFNALPTDFYSAQGGSDKFGGPQAADGSVVIVGNDFNIPRQNVNQYISFFVNQTSVVRIFTDAGQGIDLDIYIYNSTTVFTYQTLVVYSIGVGPTESKQVVLSPLSNGDNYTLSIHSYAVSSELSPCNVFKFEFALSPLLTVLDDMACPITYPDPEMPPEIINFYPSSLVVLNTAEYLLSHQRIEQYHALNPNLPANEYRYKTQLVIHAPSVMAAMLSFNFLENDFSLVLRNSAGYPVANGVFFDISERGSFFNFATQVFAQLSPGVYTLEIVETLLDSFTNSIHHDFCHRFQFYMFFISDSANPTITSIYPPSSVELNPNNDFSVQITFNAPIVSPSTSEWVQFVQNQVPVFLTKQQDTTNSKIRPYSVELQADFQTVIAVFSHTVLDFETSYVLHVDSDKFLAANSTPFAFPNSTQYVYTTRSCQCNGHGSCNAQGVCQCMYPYTGLSCDACELGYHSAGTACVQNTQCLNDTCNGHGTCDDTLGYPVCTCYDGYATFGENHCSICASGYSGYPDCKPNVSPIPVHCDAQLLPTSFDGPGYLADDGRLHIYDNYYVDYTHYRHDISFSLNKNSLVRIYIEPHVIDIDLWIYQLRDDGSIQRIVYMGIGVNGEETYYGTLPGSATKTKYLITLRYYNPNPTLLKGGNCEKANFEFAIQPVDLATTEAHQFLNSICNGRDNLPVIEQLPEGAVISSAEAFTFESSTYYTVQPVTQPTINYFFNRTFSVVTKPGEVAHISVELGDRFLTGDLAVVLEHQINSSAVCSKFSPDCEFGFNQYNLNILQARVPSGNYTLRLYEPNPQISSISPCAAFTFKMGIKFVAAADTLYNCPETMVLPTSFNEAGYIGSTGHMHFIDNYLITQYLNTFTLDQPSYFRFTSNSEFGWTAAIYNNSWNIVSTVSQEPDNYATLNVLLPNGTYYFSLFYSFADSNFDICQTSRVEFQITPVTSTNTNNLICPFSGIDSLPSLPDVLPSDYVFPDSTTTFYSFQTTAGLVWYYNFTLQQNTYIQTSVSSHFLSSDLTMKLFQKREDDSLDYVSVGVNEFNYNYIREDVSAGSYMLAIYLPNTYLNSRIRCYGFNFNFMVRNTSDAICQGYDLDTFNTLNNFRFLRSERMINFRSGNFLVPQDLIFNIRKDIDVNVFTRSTLRVFVAPHQRIDIDLFLYKIDANGVRTVVTQAPNGFKGEETIVATLEVGTRYQIEISFWNWNSATHLDPCSVFDMEIDVSPLHPLPQVCQNGAHWPVAPPATGMPKTPYSYSDIYSLNGEHFYYQQQIGSLASKSYSFNLNDYTNIYVRVGYDFTSGDLLIKLLDQSNGEVIAYGVNGINRNELRAKGVAPGNYSLLLTETVINNRDIIGCSSFTYFISVERDTGSEVQFFGDIIPPTLDTLPYLAFNNRIELNQYYIVYNPSDSSPVQTNFTIRSNSLLRVSSFFTDSDDEITISLMLGNIVIATTKSLLDTRINIPSTPETYSLKFTIPRFFISASDPIPMNLQLVIEPLTQITSDAQEYTPAMSCVVVNPPRQIQLSNSGFYSSKTLASLPSNSVPTGINDIVTYNFSITQPSVLFASAEANFLTNYVQWILVKDGVLKMNGYTSTNFNQLDRVIDAANYQLILKYVNPAQSPVRCFIYKSSIYIRPYNSANDPHADCTNYDLLPVDLDTTNGGSVPFGGPITNGQLNFHGANFLFPTTTGAQDYINMTLSANTIATIFIRARTNLRITSSLSNNVNSNSVTPVYSLPGIMSSTFRSYYIPVAAPTVYSLGLSFNDITQYLACPTFSLDILLNKKDTLQSLFLCPPSFASKLPDSVVTLDQNGFAHQSVRTYIPSSQNLASGYSITLTASVVSRLQVSLKFNSKVSYFNLTMLNTQNNRTTNVPVDVLANSNTETDLGRSLNVFIRPGTYVLTFTQSSFSPSAFGFDTSRVYCLPLEWELFLVPFSNTSTYISVNPTSSYKLSPVNDLSLTLSFSRAIYDSQHLQITSTNLQPLYNAINLVSTTSNKREVIAPTSITTTNNFEYKFVFDHFKLHTGASYQLQLTNGQIFDNRNAPVVLPTTNTYAMLNGQCGGHGNLDSNYNCKCNTGYAGSVGPCTSCDIGYHNIATNTDTVRCVKDNNEVCSTTSCGCSYTKEQPDVCIPLGTCDDSSGKVVCNCSSAYKGAHCEYCANGYQTTYPQCQAPPCVPDCKNGGTCVNGICKCAGNWDGASCSVCKPNYSGANCETYNVPGVSTQYKYLLIGGVLFLILLAIVIIGYFALRYFKSRRDRTRIVFDLGDGDDDDFFSDQNHVATELLNINTEGISKAVDGEGNDD